LSAVIRPDEWLQFIQREYLSAFVADGGAAVKFIVPMKDFLRRDLSEGIGETAVGSGYLVANINALETKVNLLDEIFFRTAEQVPWRVLSREVIAKLAADAGYSWIDNPDGPLYQRLAEHNQVDAQLLLLDLKKLIGTKVLGKRNLSRDFRVAMTHLCIAELSGGEDGSTTTGVLTDWLTGRNRALSAVKPYHIFRKINRNTARYFFESMLHWIRFAGYPGTVVILDAQRLMLAKNPRDQAVYYTKAAVLDTYEIMRQFIDSSGKLEGCLIAVLPDVAFLEDHHRGIGAYEALKFRVFDEVRDRRFVNPMASLARISVTAGGGDRDGR
jgi:hypothetical protein